jgi:hypothetical protein
MSPFDPSFAKPSIRERVEAAPKISPEEKLLAGQRLFEQECQIMLADIREQFPDANEAQYLDILRARVELAKRHGDRY